MSFSHSVKTLRTPLQAGNLWWSGYHYFKTSLNTWTELKSELRCCAVSNPACDVSEICDSENLWQWCRLEIRRKYLSSVNHSAKTSHHHQSILNTSFMMLQKRLWYATRTIGINKKRKKLLIKLDTVVQYLWIFWRLLIPLVVIF